MSSSQKPEMLLEERQAIQRLQEEIFLPSVEEVLVLFSKIRVDLVDINVLRAFYMTNKQHPYDTAPWCFPILFKGFKEKNITRTGRMGFYKKVEKLCKAGLITKLKRTNPVIFEPVDEIKYVVRRSVLMWLANRGLRVSDKK